VLSEGYGINYDNKDKIIRFLVNRYTEKEIYDVLNSAKDLKKIARWKKVAGEQVKRQWADGKNLGKARMK
jgi:hypothetical protein